MYSIDKMRLVYLSPRSQPPVLLVPNLRLGMPSAQRSVAGRGASFIPSQTEFPSFPRSHALAWECIGDAPASRAP